MKTIYDLKPAFQNVLRPCSNGLIGLGASPNAVTLSALILSIVVGSLLALNSDRWPLFLLPAALFVRMALNAIDGMMAREHQRKTALGAVLNELGDVVSDAALYLPLAWRPEFPTALVAVTVVLAGLSEMAGVVAVQIGATRRYDGPMGKSDRAFVFGALGLALGLGAPAGPWVSWIIALVALLLIFTVVNRMRKALKEAR